MPRRRISPSRLKRWLREELDTSKLLGLSSDDCATLAWQAHLRLQGGKFAEAARIFRLLRTLERPDNVTSRLGEGVCLQSQGALGDAEIAYGAVLSFDPENVFALTNRAEVRLLTARTEAALADLAIALDLLDRARKPAELRERIEKLRQLARAAPDETATAARKT